MHTHCAHASNPDMMLQQKLFQKAREDSAMYQGNASSLVALDVTCIPSCRCASSMCSFLNTLLQYALFSMRRRG